MAKKKDNQAKKEAKKQRQDDKMTKKAGKAGKAMFGGDDIDAILAEFAESDRKKNTVQYEEGIMPSPRTGAMFVAHPTKPECFVFGGEVFDGRKVTTYNDGYLYNTTKGTWTKLTVPNGPGPRTSAACAVVQDSGTTAKMYMMGGDFTSANQQFKFFQDVWSFDMNNKVWEKLQTTGKGPSSRSGHRCVVYKMKLYIFGGFYDNHQSIKYFDDLYVLDLRTLAWTNIPKTPNWPAPRSGFGFCLHEGTGSAVMLGGYTTIPRKKNSFEERSNVLTDMWQLNLATCTWSSLPSRGDSPSAISGFTLFSVRNHIYLFGGVSDVEHADDDTIDSTFNNEMREYNLRKRTWEMLPVRVGRDPSRRGEGGDDVEEHMIANEARRKQAEQDTAVEAVSTQLRGASAWKWGSEGEADAEQQALASKKRQEEEDAEAAEAAAEAIMAMELAEVDVDDNDEEETQKLRSHLGYVWPRRNAQICVRNTNVYLFGGVFERGDTEVTLNDMHTMPAKTKPTQWFTLVDSDLSHHVWYEEEEDSEDEEEEPVKGNNKYDIDMDDDEEEDDDDEEEEEPMQDGDHPPIRANEDVKAYFARTKEYWMSEAMMEAEEVLTDKKMRQFAFQMATAAIQKK